ncbi:MAG: hypothetical protein ACE5GN_06145 [Waddliaceae bacterium]
MKGDKLAFQIKFWALIGPLICLLALFVFIVKSSTGFIMLPLFLIIGVPLCWRWKLWGVAISAGLLVCFLGYYYSEIPLEERFWYLGMGFAISIALFITALSFEEVEALVAAIQLESRSRLENLWKVDEKQRHTEENLKKRREQIRELQVKVRSYQKLVDMSTGELVDLRENYNKVTEELERVRKEKDQLEEAQRDPSNGAEQRQLREQFDEKSRVLDETRRELFFVQEELVKSKKEQEEMQLSHINEVEEVLQRHLNRLEKERAEEEEQHQQDLDALQEVVTAILKEKNP